MKRIFLFCLTIFAASSILAQTELSEEPIERKAFTVGILNGGGSLIGFDLEILFTKRVGIQAGVGVLGYGAGINYHLKPSIRSSFISLQYWHQGMNESFTQDLIGPSFVYRGKYWITGQLGLGVPLSKGAAFPEDKEQPPIMLTYSIGLYFSSL